MRKRLMMTTAMLLLSLFTSVGLWAEYVTGNFKGDPYNVDIEWSYSTEGGTLIITGTGAIPDFNTTSYISPWTSLPGDITQIAIGDGITRIGNYSFSKNDLLKGVTYIKLPSSIKSIGVRAFSGSGLQDIPLNEGLESIEKSAFYNCSFKTFTIPKTVTNISTTILSSISSLKVEEGNSKYTSRDANGNECNVIMETATKKLIAAYDVSTIPQDVENVGEQAFFDCNFTEINLPSVKTIGNEAFERCSYLEKLTLGENLTSIGERALYGLSKLKTLVFNGMEPPTFGTDCFKYVNNLTVDVPADHSTLEKYKATDELKNYKFTMHGNRFYMVVDANNTLTFRYDSNLDFGTDVNVFEFGNFGREYQGGNSLNAMMKEKGYEDGLNYITTVNFDEGVADFRPTSCANWFSGFSKLTAINNLDRLNTEEVTAMNNMFYGCNSLNSLNLSNFNTEKVTTMDFMFNRCYNLTALDLRTFNTAKVNYMNSMFSWCNNLKDIYVSDNFTTKGLYNDNTMFDHCQNLTTSPGTNEVANYNTDKGNFKKVVGTLGGELIGARGKVLTIDNLTLTDNKLLVLTETEPVKAAKASYSRAMTSTWGTLCLPYDIDTDDETGNCRYYAVETKTSDAITLKQLTGTIAAATPVIFCRKASSTDANVTGSGVLNTTAGTSDVLNTTAGTSSVLAGTFETKTLDDADYFIAKDAFRLAGDYKSGSNKGVKVAPYRAYIQGQGGAQPSVLHIMGGQATGISNATANDLSNAAAEYYTADGRRTDGLQKGLNIVKIGGKTRKVIVK